MFNPQPAFLLLRGWEKGKYGVSSSAQETWPGLGSTGTCLGTAGAVRARGIAEEPWPRGCSAAGSAAGQAGRAFKQVFDLFLLSAGFGFPFFFPVQHTELVLALYHFVLR